MQTLLKQILQELNQNRLQHYWQGYTITACAVYDQKDVYLFNHPKFVAQGYIKIPKTNQFTACTLILFEEFPTAIVYVTIYYRFEEIYSIIIHELFNGYQYTYGEARFPDEIIGLSYPIDAQI